MLALCRLTSALAPVATETCHPLPPPHPTGLPLHIGTCAWSFDEWHGVFYPPNLPSNERLAVYARSLSSVEIDSTFYAPPHPDTARHWRDSTPEHFVFSCKMPRAITHERRLHDCRDILQEFLHAITPLQPKLGAVLLQFPASFKLRPAEEAALRDFLPLLPRSFRFAIEFRDARWHLPRITHLLEDHRVCWAWSDLTPLAHQAEAPYEYTPITTDFLYLRLMGDQATKFGGTGQRLFQYTKLMWPRDGALESWSVKIRQHEAELAWANIYANNHFEGYSPATCQRISALLGHQISLPELPPVTAVKPTTQLELGI